MIKKEVKCDRCKGLSDNDLDLSNYLLGCFKNISNAFPNQKVHLKFLLKKNKRVVLIWALMDEEQFLDSEPEESPDVKITEFNNVKSPLVSNYKDYFG